MSDLRVLGVDPSLTKTGLCLAWPGAQPVPSASTTSPRAGGGQLDVLRRFDLQRRKVTELALGADLVVVEGLAFAAHDRGRALAGLWWHLLAALVLEGVEVLVVPPAVLKKWTTGRGNADKFAMGQAIAKRWPQVHLDGPDEADALALASLGLHHLGALPWQPTAYQEDQLSRVECIPAAPREETRHAG